PTAPLATMATPTAASGPSAADGTPTSNAALATGGFRPLAGGNDLRINGTAGAETGAPNGVTLQAPTFGASPPAVAVAQGFGAARGAPSVVSLQAPTFGASPPAVAVAPGFGAAPVNNQFVPAAVTPVAAAPTMTTVAPGAPAPAGRVYTLDQGYAALKRYNVR